MRVPYLPEERVARADGAARRSGSRAHPRRLAGRRTDHHRRPCRQQRRDRRGDRPPRPAAQRGRRRFVVPGAVRVPHAAARAVARDAHPVAQPAGDLRRAPTSRAARPARRLGLSQRRDPGPPVRCLDDVAGRARPRSRPRRRRGSCPPSPTERPDGRAAGDPRRADLGRRRTIRPTSSARPRRSPTPSLARSGPRRSSGTASSRSGRRLPRRPPTSSDGRGRCRPASPTRARRAACHATRRTRSGSTRGGRAVTFRGRLLLAASWLACRLPERPLFRVAGPDRRPVVPAGAGPRRPGAAQPAPRVPSRSRRPDAAAPAVRAAATDPIALERLVRSAFRHHARYYLEVARGPERHAGLRRRAAPDRHARADRRGRRARARPSCSSASTSARWSWPSIFLAFQVGETVTPMETIDDPGLQAYFERTRGVAGIRLVGLREARRELTQALRERHPGRPRRRSRPDRRRHPDPAVRGPRGDADGAGDAGRRERRPDLRDDRPARRRRATFAASSSRSRSRPTAPAASASRPR